MKAKRTKKFPIFPISEADECPECGSTLCSFNATEIICPSCAGRELSALQSRVAALEAVAEAARGLVYYRRRAGPLNFQLEKADDYINAMRNELEAASAADAEGER